VKLGVVSVYLKTGGDHFWMMLEEKKGKPQTFFLNGASNCYIVSDVVLFVLFLFVKVPNLLLQKFENTQFSHKTYLTVEFSSLTQPGNPSQPKRKLTYQTVELSSLTQPGNPSQPKQKLTYQSVELSSLTQHRDGYSQSLCVIMHT